MPKSWRRLFVQNFFYLSRQTQFTCPDFTHRLCNIISKPSPDGWTACSGCTFSFYRTFQSDKTYLHIYVCASIRLARARGKTKKQFLRRELLVIWLKMGGGQQQNLRIFFVIVFHNNQPWKRKTTWVGLSRHIRAQHTYIRMHMHTYICRHKTCINYIYEGSAQKYPRLPPPPQTALLNTHTHNSAEVLHQKTDKYCIAIFEKKDFRHQKSRKEKRGMN